MPSAAVIATWVLTTLWMLALGSAVWPMAAPRFGRVAALRVSLWFGLAIALLLLLIVNFLVPLVSPQAVIAVAAITVLSVVVMLGQWLRARGETRQRSIAFTFPLPQWSLPLLLGLSAGLVAFAHATFGSVNQWDAGLYHLNAIQYAGEYRVIPGLANLHDRLGVTNGQHLLTAFLGNSGWGIDAFRLQVGFFAFLAATELGLRLVQHRNGQGGSVRMGTMVLSLGLIGAWPFLLSNPDELITSPSPDSIALLLTLVGGAFLADAFAQRSWNWAAAGAVTLATAASVRAQLWAFLILTIVVWALFIWRTRPETSTKPSRLLVCTGAALTFGLALATQTRDAIQTGWLLFPLDQFPLPVDWKAFDPAASRAWIIAWARSPGSSPDEVNDNWQWVGDWTIRNIGDWSTQLMLGLLMLALTLWLLRQSVKQTKVQGSHQVRVLLMLIPTTIGVVLWFLTAPDPRFAWGLIVLLGAIPCAVALTWVFGNAQIGVVMTAGVAALLVVPASIVALTQIGSWKDEPRQLLTFTGVPWTISVAVSPVPSPELAVYVLPTGQELITPTTDDRCWLAFPLCRPYPNNTLIFRGDSVQDGFASRQWTDVTPAIAPNGQ